ncbi:hypothetical protein G9A89_015407 [Geosiphon pyriformis]|nr:hypothetical protein G9A89_015407 [Geosiphon pyriformis]
MLTANLTNSLEIKSSRRVGYVFSDEYTKVAALLPSNQNRSFLTHSLIRAYSLFEKLSLIEPYHATLQDLTQFHSSDFIDFLLNVENSPNEFTKKEDIRVKSNDRDGIDDNEWEEGGTFEELVEDYGLAYDCPIFPGLAEYVRMVAGSTIIAARLLVNGEFDVAIHWDGGRHHAKKSECHGFCYVNDIVLGIIELRQKFSKVLYIDLDLHHSDGVESAFLYTDKVMTISFHYYATGFYPGTGALNHVGQGKGLYHAINVPLKQGLKGSTFLYLSERILNAAYNAFEPHSIVVQCGCDGLFGDPSREWNLDIQSFGQCVKGIVDWKKPTLILGGGGYNHANVARCNAYVTSLLIEIPLPHDIPEHEYFEQYGPDFSLFVDQGNQPDANDQEYVSHLLNTITENLEQMRSS